MTELRSRARAIARHGALDLLSTRYKLLSLVERGWETPRVHFPYLHTVPPQEEPTFRLLLTELAKTHTFISYSDAVERVKHGPIDRPYMAFSFDDGFKSNVRVAAILEEFGTRGMFFVPSGFVGTETVSDARAFFGFSEGVTEGAMTWADLQDLVARGHEVGNHTAGHKVMSWVNQATMQDEIHRGREELQAHLGRIDHFAWPRGRFFHFTDAAARAVFEAGHLSCASAERGAHSVPHQKVDSMLCLRRDHLMSDWPLRHSRYFLSKSSLRSSASDNNWPEGWHV